jgi:PAS domain-containing protein
MNDKMKNGDAQEIKALAERIKELQKSGITYAEQELIIQDRREYAESIINTVREPLIILDADLRVITASKAFYHTFKVTAQETELQFIYDLGNRQWDIPILRKLLNDILPKHKTFDNYKVEHNFPAIGKRSMLLNARWIPREVSRPQIILLAIEDIVECEKGEQSLRDKVKELEICRQTVMGMELKIEGLNKKVRELETRLQKNV